MATALTQLLPQALNSMRTSSEVSQRGALVVISNENSEASISLYQGPTAQPKEIAVAMSRLSTAFPKMSNGFFSILSERLIDKGFTQERLRDAINDVIDNFHYKELTIADIVKFDRRLKLYSYNEVCNLVTKGEASFSDFETREISGKVFKIKKSDIR